VTPPRSKLSGSNGLASRRPAASLPTWVTRLKVLDPARKLLMPLQDCLLGGLKDAIQATDHREREDHLPVLGLLVVPAQEVSDRPDKGRMIADDLAIAHEYDPAPLGSCRRA
jgi:hypothetical protein